MPRCSEVWPAAFLTICHCRRQCSREELTSWKRSNDAIVLRSAKEAPCRLGAWGFGGCLAAVSSSAFATCTQEGRSHEEEG